MQVLVEVCRGHQPVFGEVLVSPPGAVVRQLDAESGDDLVVNREDSLPRGRAVPPAEPHILVYRQRDRLRAAEQVV